MSANPLKFDEPSPLINTKKFLNLLATHLSHREDLRQFVYYVHIHESGYVVFFPNVHIFPNRYHRKPEDKKLVLNHVLWDHMNTLVDKDATTSTSLFHVHRNSMICGEYVYKFSISRVKRNWIML